MDGKVKDLLHNIPAPALLILPVFLLLFFVFLLLNFLPSEFLLKCMIILLLTGTSIFSRAIEAWQFGVEIHHVILFGIAYVFGIWWALLFVIVTSLVNMSMVLLVRSHMFIHTMLGPMLQTLDLLLVAILSGIYGAVSGGVFSSDTILIATGIIALGTIMEKLLCYKFAGVDLGRLSTATVVAILVNYNLLLYLGRWYISLLGSL